jgi:hypothetical protein
MAGAPSLFRIGRIIGDRDPARVPRAIDGSRAVAYKENFS